MDIRKIRCSVLFLSILFLISRPAMHLYAADTPFDRGMAEYRAGNYEEALGYFEKAYRDDPIDPHVTLYMGLTHRDMQDYADAVRFFKETIALARDTSPDMQNVHFLLADVLFGMESYEDALTAVDTAISRNERPASAQYLRGRILLGLKRSKEALSAFKRAKELDPSFAQQAAFQIATVYMQEKDYAKARDIFSGLISVEPASNWAVFSKDYLEALEKVPKRYRLNLGFGYQYDDNALAVPLDSALIGIPRQKDWKRIYSLFGEYTVLERGPWDLKASYSLDIEQYNKSDYRKSDGTKVFSQDTVSHTVSLMPSYNTEKNVTSLLLSYNYLAIDYTKYMQSFLINPSYTFLLNGSHFGQVFARYRKDEQNFNFFNVKYGSLPTQDENESADNVGGGVGYFYTFSEGNGLFNIRAELERNDARGANWDFAGARGSAGLLYPFCRNKLKANVFTDLYYQHFTHVNTIYLKKRKDTTLTAQASLTYTIIKPLDIIAGYTYIRDNSNVGAYHYSRNLYTVSLEYRF